VDNSYRASSCSKPMSESTVVSSKLLLGLSNRISAMAKNTTTDTLIDNLLYLKRLRGDSVYAIGKRAKMSPRTVSNILAREQEKVSIEQTDALAKAYGLEGWHLMLPNLPRDLVESPHIAKLFKNYIMATTDGRALINLVAEREASYGQEQNQK